MGDGERDIDDDSFVLLPEDFELPPNKQHEPKYGPLEKHFETISESISALTDRLWDTLGTHSKAEILTVLGCLLEEEIRIKIAKFNDKKEPVKENKMSIQDRFLVTAQKKETLKDVNFAPKECMPKKLAEAKEPVKNFSPECCGRYDCVLIDGVWRCPKCEPLYFKKKTKLEPVAFCEEDEQPMTPNYGKVHHPLEGVPKSYTECEEKSPEVHLGKYRLGEYQPAMDINPLTLSLTSHRPKNEVTLDIVSKKADVIFSSRGYSGEDLERIGLMFIHAAKLQKDIENQAMKCAPRKSCE